MIKLSDYLNYINNEIIQVRKKADENAILTAKEYASHEYLKYFKAPRYAFVNIRIDIPLKFRDISASSTDDFKLDDAKFLLDLNEKMEAVNKEKDKLFINLHLEMEEEGLRLVTFTDKDDQQIEEIIFE